MQNWCAPRLSPAGDRDRGQTGRHPILNGRMPGLASKRLAGVLAWWVPGARDVVNGIAVEPPRKKRR